MSEQQERIGVGVCAVGLQNCIERGVLSITQRSHGVMTLLAGLELTRRRRVKLRQVEMFSELWMYPRAGGVEDPEAVEQAGAQEGEGT